MTLLHSLLTTSTLVFFILGCTPTQIEPLQPEVETALQLPVLKEKKTSLC